MDLWVLVLLLVRGLNHSETIIANELLGNLLWLAVIRAKWSWNTSRVQSADVWLMLSQLIQQISQRKIFLQFSTLGKPGEPKAQ